MANAFDLFKIYCNNMLIRIASMLVLVIPTLNNNNSILPVLVCWYNKNERTCYVSITQPRTLIS